MSTTFPPLPEPPTVREALAELVRLQDTPDEHENWDHVDAAWAAARAALAQHEAQPVPEPLSDQRIDQLASNILSTDWRTVGGSNAREFARAIERLVIERMQSRK